MRKSTLCALLMGAAFMTSAATATFHLIQINEVYSNADGSIQYVELIATANGQTNLGPTRVVSRNATNGAETILFDFVANYAWSSGQTLLIATPAFEAAAGFAPDFVMPAQSLIFTPNGRVLFRRDTAAAVDSVAYGAFTGNNGTFGTPATALPTDGVHSLTRINTSMDNSIGFAVMVNSPKRTDGMTTTLNPGGGDPCPGDTNGDGIVDFTDFSTVLNQYGQTGPGLTGDLNGDEIVDFTDFSIVLANYGVDCE